jgi:hypothetical protein
MKPWLVAVLLIFSGVLAWSDVPKLNVESKQTNAVAKLIQEGKQLYELGNISKAKAVLKQALKLEPSNKAAYYYLDLIKEAEYRERADKRHVDDGEMLLTDPPKSPRTGEWINPHFVYPKERELPVPHVTLPSVPLKSKAFQLDIKAVTEKLHLVADGGTVIQTIGDTTYVIRGNHSQERHQQVQEWVRGLGVDISSAGKSVFLNDRTGWFAVRATEKELALIEAAVQPMLAADTKSEKAKP